MSSAHEELFHSPAPVPGPWRDLPPAPHRPVHARIARALLHRAVNRLPVRVELPDGSTTGAGASHDPLIRIRDDAFFHRVGSQGLIGFGESYMARDWDTDDIEGALRPLVENALTLVPQWMQRLKRFYVQHLPSNEANTVHGARRNIARHYDLSNELFALFLDETMTYSSAVFETPDQPLAEAQRTKYRRMAERAGLRSGQHVLEIGTGWGGFALYAAGELGCRVTTVTVSRAQHDLAVERIRLAGLADRVDVQLRDYREVQGRYDAIVSIEMLEAVGEEFLATYFELCDRVLVPGGRMSLQSISFPDAMYESQRRSANWIQTYIFPGGFLPSLAAIERATRRTNLLVSQVDDIAVHYVRTLQHWRSTFMSRLDAVRALGFDDRFIRMWEYYLALSEAGFDTGLVQDLQVVLEKRRGLA